MIEWHAEHMEKTVLKYVRGIAQNATAWERRNHKRYGSLANICKQIEYDIKHGVTSDQVTTMLLKVRHDPKFSELRGIDGSLQRLADVEDHFSRSKSIEKWNWQ